MIQVAQDGTGDFTTLQAAINTIPVNNNAPIMIHIKNGVYKEEINISQHNVHLVGEDKEQTIITYDNFAQEILNDGEKRGTFRTPTIFIDANDFSARNITFQNTAGLGPKVGQALALYVDGDRIMFENCNMIASQDTLFTAPLPPEAFEKNGFRGPKEFAPRINGRHFYKNCFIRGDIDFIFGSATAVFEGCELFSQNLDREINGYVTAASTAENQEYGYIFNQCIFTSNCKKHSVYLGRPWRNFAKVVIMNSKIDDHIHEEGWHDWDKKDAHKTVFFAEYNNEGSGADLSKRPDWVHILNQDEIAYYDKDLVLKGDDDWNP